MSHPDNPTVVIQSCVGKVGLEFWSDGKFMLTYKITYVKLHHNPALGIKEVRLKSDRQEPAANQGTETER